MNVRYVNHQGENINLDDDKIILQYQELYDYSWDTESKNGKITGFYRENATIPISVGITADTEEEYLKILNDFFRVIEKDIMTLRNGRLYLGKQYLNCFISGSLKEDAFMGVLFQIKNLTLITDCPFWITEEKHEFKINIGKEVGEYLDFPFDTPFDLMGDEKGIGNVILDHYAPCDFLLTVYGPCVNPRIVIGNNLYEVKTKLDAGEYMLIDSRAGTVVRVRTNGVKVNEFDNRVTNPNSPFEKIQPGYNLVSWDGSFWFDLLLFIERSEPVW